MNFKLKIWRQKNSEAPGAFKDYTATEIPSDASFLEMLDIVNEGLTASGEDPIAFDSDCREGICGMCSLVINGVPHGAQFQSGNATCQLHMRKFKEGDVVTIEPWRARAFPVMKDLICNRSS